MHARTGTGSRRRTAVAVVVVGALAFGAGAGVAAIVRSVESARRAESALSDPLTHRRLEVATALESRYYRTLDDDAVDAATAAPGLESLPTALGDPYTRYLSPAERASWQRSDDGQYVGVGIVATQTPAGASVAEQVVTARLDTAAGRPVGVIGLTAFDGGVGQQVRDDAAALRARGARMLVLDLRVNGGGLVSEARHVAGAFLPDDTAVFTEHGAHLDTRTYTTDGAPAVGDLPLAVLVDHDTASASEIVAGALRDAHRARIVGTRTFGKGVIQDVLPLGDGGAVKLTIAEYLTPDGTAIDHRGIEPDTVVAAPAGSPDPALVAAAGGTSS